MAEMRTKALLMEFLSGHTDLRVCDRGKWFCAFSPGSSGQSPIAFRGDYDAVLCEDGQARHLCGHDGHSAALCGLAAALTGTKHERPVWLIFQPGEETGQGALLCRSLIGEAGITEIYGMHNIPGVPENQILLPEGTFACASTGLEIVFTGKASHAAYPEQGRNPAAAIAAMVRCSELIAAGTHRGIVKSTVIGIELGSRSYGVSAGEGTLRLTVRAEHPEEYDAAVDTLCRAAREQAECYGLACRITRIEEFPATVNHPACTRRVREAAARLGLEAVAPAEPFRWSEDFGWYLREIPGAFFGVGCGEKHPGLHTDHYEFNDAILPAIIDLYLSLVYAG